MLVSIGSVFVLWMLLELALYGVHCWRCKGLTIAPRRQQDRVLLSLLTLSSGIFFAVLVYLMLP